MVISCLMLIIFLFVGKNSMTGFVVGIPEIEFNGWKLLSFILAGIIIGLLIYHSWKRTRGPIRGKFSKNSLRGLVGKEVYSGGDYIGKVNQVILGDCEIDSLKIEFDKGLKKQLKVLGVDLKFKNVISVGDIVFVEMDVLEYLRKEQKL